MNTWLPNEALYRRFTNAALIVVIIAALFANKWPEYGMIAGAVTIAVTLVTVGFYVATVTNRGRDDKRDQPSAAMDMSVGRLSVDDDNRDRLSDRVVESPKTTPPEPQKEISASAGTTGAEDEIVAYLRAWSDLPRREREPVITELLRAGWMDDLSKPGRDAIGLWHRHLELYNPAARRIQLHGPGGVGKSAMAARYWAFNTMPLRERPAMSATEKKETGRVIVAVGPLTIEINDDETTIHVDATKTKVVTTNVSADSQNTVEEIGVNIPSSSRSIH